MKKLQSKILNTVKRLNSAFPRADFDIGLLEKISHADTPVYGFPGISDRPEYKKRSIRA
jgi:hypothetical protein